MPGGKIYLREKDGLVPMMEEGYLKEDDLQALLADYPDLLAGDQMRPSEPRRWLLITREAGVPDAQGGLSRWSLDHLFIDQDAIPTLVEVKRSSNTQIRREVVGQMLDYAANIVAYWPASRLRQTFEDRRRSGGAEPDLEVLGLIGGDPVPEDQAALAVDKFWLDAADNLAARRIRMLFVADVIPPELERIIVFLNENLVKAEVLAVEVKQYLGAGPDRERQTLVPRVIGRTVAADDLKRGASGGAPSVRRNWTLDEFRSSTLEVGGVDALAVLDEGLVWVQRHGGTLTFGHGKYGPLYLVIPSRDRQPAKVLSIDAGGAVWVGYGTLNDYPPFDDASERVGINHRLNEIAGISIPDDMAVRASSPQVRLEALRLPAVRAAFFGVFDDVAFRLAGDPSR